MSIQNNKKLITSGIFIALLVVLAVAITIKETNYFGISDESILDLIYMMPDPVEKQEALRSYWGRKITHEVFNTMFGIKITDEGISDYILQPGSADGSREAVATAFFLGAQPNLSNSDQQEVVSERFDKYYVATDIESVEKKEIVKSVINQFSPSLGFDFNGVYLIDRDGWIYADFNGIQIPVNLTTNKLKSILMEIKPIPNKLNMRVSLL